MATMKAWNTICDSHRERMWRSLRLALTGAQSVRLDSSGNLLLTVGGKEMRMKRPAVYEYEDVATRWHSKQRQRHSAVGSGGPRTHSTYKPRKLRDPPQEKKTPEGAATSRGTLQAVSLAK